MVSGLLLLCFSATNALNGRSFGIGYDGTKYSVTTLTSDSLESVWTTASDLETTTDNPLDSITGLTAAVATTDLVGDINSAVQANNNVSLTIFGATYTLDLDPDTQGAVAISVGDATDSNWVALDGISTLTSSCVMDKQNIASASVWSQTAPSTSKIYDIITYSDPNKHCYVSTGWYCKDGMIDAPQGGMAECSNAAGSTKIYMNDQGFNFKATKAKPELEWDSATGDSGSGAEFGFAIYNTNGTDSDVDLLIPLFVIRATHMYNSHQAWASMFDANVIRKEDGLAMRNSLWRTFVFFCLFCLDATAFWMNWILPIPVIGAWCWGWFGLLVWGAILLGPSVGVLYVGFAASLVWLLILVVTITTCVLCYLLAGKACCKCKCLIAEKPAADIEAVPNDGPPPAEAVVFQGRFLRKSLKNNVRPARFSKSQNAKFGCSCLTGWILVIALLASFANWELAYYKVWDRNGEVQLEEFAPGAVAKAQMMLYAKHGFAGQISGLDKSMLSSITGKCGSVFNAALETDEDKVKNIKTQFVDKYEIDMSIYVRPDVTQYETVNDWFSRRIDFAATPCSYKSTADKTCNVSTNLTVAASSGFTQGDVLAAADCKAYCDRISACTVAVVDATGKCYLKSACHTSGGAAETGATMMDKVAAGACSDGTSSTQSACETASEVWGARCGGFNRGGASCAAADDQGVGGCGDTANACQLVNSADSRVVVYPYGPPHPIWIKDEPFSIEGLLTARENAADHVIPTSLKEGESTLVIWRLAPQDYHCFHSPVAGEVIDIYEAGVKGQLHSVSADAMTSGSGAIYNERQVLIFNTDVAGGSQMGTVAYVAIGAMCVGSVNLATLPHNHSTIAEAVDIKVGDFINSGAFIGYMQFGGSTVAMVAESNKLTIDQDLIYASQLPVENLVTVRSSLGVSAGTCT